MQSSGTPLPSRKRLGLKPVVPIRQLSPGSWIMPENCVEQAIQLRRKSTQAGSGADQSSSWSRGGWAGLTRTQRPTRNITQQSGFGTETDLNIRKHAAHQAFA